ncbi:MAG: hypothetical protein AAFY76_22090, partial [Cyanobacteria bacterium J06649_11]
MASRREVLIANRFVVISILRRTIKRHDLCFKAGKDNVVADALSRLPVSDSDLDSTVPAEYVHMVQTINMNEEINFEKIKSLTKRDPVLKKVLNSLKLGWTNDPLISEYA